MCVIQGRLLGIAADEDYGDYTNITEGRDFTIDAVEDMVAGRKVVKCNLRVKPKTTPISEDAPLVQKVLDEQPDILTINKRFTFEELQETLNKWLNPDDAAETETPIASVNVDVDDEDELFEEKSTTSNTPSTPAYTLETAAAKPNNADKFESLFND